MQGSRKRPRSRGTTRIGRINPNRQEVVRKTERRGNDHYQFVYILLCKKCTYKYGANGSNLGNRRCPRCDGGRPGL
jgi:hypothetical protein